MVFTIREDLMRNVAAVRKENTGKIRNRHGRGLAIFNDREPRQGEHRVTVIVLGMADGTYQNVTGQLDEPVPDGGEQYFLYARRKVDLKPLESGRKPYRPDRVYGTRQRSERITAEAHRRAKEIEASP